MARQGNSTRMDGEVARIVRTKGFFFIKGEDNRQFFAHHTSLTNRGFDSLLEGQKVTFDEAPDRGKGPRADSVTVA